jgi:tetratricopeptide (TPR) repeat protein
VESDDVVEDTETMYENLVQLMQSIECMTVCDAKVEMYQKVAKQLTGLSGYKDSDGYAKKCEQLAQKMKDKVKAAVYERAENRMKVCANADDYQSAAQEFRMVRGYRDSDELAAKCDQMNSVIVKKASGKHLLYFVIFVIFVAALMFGATRPRTKYVLANAYQFIGSYNPAINMYRKLDQYKDSPQRLMECEYHKALSAKAGGDYQSAVKAFGEAGTYKDSQKQRVEAEKELLRKCARKDIVRIGDCKWRVLDIRKNQVLLMRKSALPEMSYHNTLEYVTWEKSAIRKWMNSEYLTKTFSEAERKNILLTKVINSNNSQFGTDGGNDTQDYMFLLSMEEAEKYKSLFPKFKSNSWLRSPGSSGKNAIFISENGAIMDSGYAVNSNEITARPTFWFNIGA